MGTDPLKAAEQQLLRAGAEMVLVEVGSGTSDSERPKFRQLRELILDRKVSTVICPSQDRLGRNLELVMDFIQLCHMQGVELLDLNGRALEVKTADGRLMTQIVGALDEHRSRLYGEKVRRAYQEAKKQGLPARSKIPFGLKKVRNDAGRFVAVEVDPITGPIARQRIQWFLDGASLVSMTQRIRDKQPDHPMQRRNLAFWLAHPMLTGRRCWGRQKDGTFTEVEPEPSFEGFVTDAEHQLIKTRLEASSNASGRRGRQLRMLSGLCRCGECGRNLTYKTHKHSEVIYLRCSNPDGCSRHSKNIDHDRVFAVLQFALHQHAKALLPLLATPRSDPPEVMKLLQEVKTLESIDGTEMVVEMKRAEINRLRGVDTSTPAWILIGCLRSQTFWLQDDEVLNRLLRVFIDHIEISLGDSVKDSKVAAVRCKTAPSEAPLPADQKNVLIPITLKDLAVTLTQQKKIEEAIATIGRH